MGLSFHDFVGRQERLFREAAWDFDYSVPADKEQQLYDFYMLNFLDMLDLAPHRHEERAFSELDVDKFQWILLGVKEKLYPYLANNIKNSLFFAITCEMRHALDYCSFDQILGQLLDGRAPNLTRRELVRRSENRHPKVVPYDEKEGGPATLSVNNSSYREDSQSYNFTISGYGSVDLPFETVFDIARNDSTYSAMRTVESILFPREAPPEKPEPKPEPPKPQPQPKAEEEPGSKSYKWSDWLKKLKQTGNLPHEQTVYEAKKPKAEPDDDDEDGEPTAVKCEVSADTVTFSVYGVLGQKTFRTYKIPLKSVMSLAKLAAEHKEDGSEALRPWLQEQFSVDKKYAMPVANEIRGFYHTIRSFENQGGTSFLVSRGKAGYDIQTLPQSVIDAVVVAMEQYDTNKAKSLLLQAKVPEQDVTDMASYIEGNFWNPEHRKVCASLVSYIKKQAEHGSLHEIITQDTPAPEWRNRDLPHNSEELAEIWSRYRQEMGNVPGHVKNRSKRYDKRFGVDPASSTYKQSYKAAMAACNDRRKIFARLAEYVFEYGHWPSSFGGYAWWRIARGYQRVADASKPWNELQKRGDPVTHFVANKDKLYKPTIGEPGQVPPHLADKSMGQQYIGMSGDVEYKAARAAALQSMHDAIDHCYDLVHNTGPAFNKVAAWHKNSSDSWLRAALDEKAGEDIRSPFDLYHKVSPDMKKLCAEITHRFFGDDLESFQRRLAKKGKTMKSGGYDQPGNKSYIEPLRQMRRKHYAMITTRFLDSAHPEVAEPDWKDVDTMRITIPKAAWPWINSMPRDTDFHWDLKMEEMPEFLKKSGSEFTLATPRDDTASRINLKFPELKDYVCASLARYLEEKAAKKLKRVERLLSAAAAEALKKQKQVVSATKQKEKKPGATQQPQQPVAAQPQEPTGALKSATNYYLQTENGKQDIGLKGAKRISTYYFENGNYSDPVYQSFCRGFMHYGAAPADTLKFLQTYLEPNSGPGQQVKDFKISLVQFNNLVNQKVMTRLGSQSHLQNVANLLAGKTSQQEKIQAIKAVEGSNPCSNVFALRLLTTYYAMTLAMATQDQGSEIKHTVQGQVYTFYVPAKLTPITITPGKPGEFKLYQDAVYNYAYMAQNNDGDRASDELGSNVAFMSDATAQALVEYIGKNVKLPAGFKPQPQQQPEPKPEPEPQPQAQGQPGDAGGEFSGSNADGSIKHKYVEGGKFIEFYVKNQYETTTVKMSVPQAAGMAKSVQNNSTIATVKQIKDEFGVKLYTAKVLAEYIAEHISIKVSHVDTGKLGNIIFHIDQQEDKTISKSKVLEIAQMLKSGEKVKAVKYLKETYSLSLYIAKVLAEYIGETFGNEVQPNVTHAFQGDSVTFTVGGDSVTMTKDDLSNMPIGVDPVNIAALDSLSSEKASIVVQYIAQHWGDVFQPWVSGTQAKQTTPGKIQHSLDQHSGYIKFGIYTPTGTLKKTFYLDKAHVKKVHDAKNDVSYLISVAHIPEEDAVDVIQYIEKKWDSEFKDLVGGATEADAGSPEYYKAEVGGDKFDGQTPAKDMQSDAPNEIQMHIDSGYSAEGGTYSIPGKYNGSKDNFVYVKLTWELMKEVYDKESTAFADYARLQKEGTVTDFHGKPTKISDLVAYGLHLHIIVRWAKIKETMLAFVKKKTTTKTGAKKPGVKPATSPVPDPKFPKIEHTETGIVVQKPVKLGAYWVFVPAKYFAKQTGAAWARAMISDKSVDFVRQKVANNKAGEATTWLKSCMPNLTDAGYQAMSACLNAKSPADPTKYLVNF